ncbi:MAG: exopolysaccharide transport family protein [Xanthobacter sp.]
MSTPHMAGQINDAAPPAPMQEEGLPSFTLRDFLIFTFYHLRIVLLAALLPVIIGIVASLVVKTEYTANSLLLVIVNRETSTAQDVTDSGPAVLSVEGLKQVESEVQMLESADVIRATIEQVGINRLFPSSPLSSLLSIFSQNDEDQMDKDIARFRKHLRAGVLSGSNVLEVSFSSPNRDIAIKTTNALVQNYLSMRKRVFENPTSQILQLEVERFRRDLSAVDKDIEALKNKVSVIDFNQDSILASNQLDAIVQRMRQVEEREVTLKGQLAEAERQLKATPESVFDFSEKTDALSGDETGNILSRLLMERDRLAAQYAPGSPLLREIDKKITTIKQRIKDRGNTAYYTDRAVRNPAVAYTENLIINLQVELDSIANQKQELEGQLATSQERLDVLRAAETRLVELERRRTSLNDGFREYERRAVAAKIEETAAQTRESNVRLVQEAGASVTKRSLTLPLLLAGLFGGLLFGIAAGTIASVLRSIYIVPREAERMLGLPALVTLDAGAETAPSQKVEQTIGSCATLLLDTKVDGKPLRVMHFIATAPDDALVWFSHRLAEEFATQRQMRTLMVDLCSPSPYPIKTADIRSVGGLAITPTPVDKLWSAADVENSPLLSVRLPVAEGEDMLDQLRKDFDCVVICSVLHGTALVTRRLCHLVDGNVLTVHAEETRKAAAVNLRDTVAESGGALLGLGFFGRRYYLPHWLYKVT